MTSRLHPERRRRVHAVAYVAATVFGGIGALVVLVVTLLSTDAGLLDALRWAALAVLLLGAAAYHWWFAGPAEDRSRRIASGLEPEDVADAERYASGEIDAIRRLRVAHPGLGLRDAHDLVTRHGGQLR